VDVALSLNWQAARLAGSSIWWQDEPKSPRQRMPSSVCPGNRILLLQNCLENGELPENVRLSFQFLFSQSLLKGLKLSPFD